MKGKILSVEQVKVSILERNPPLLLLRAVGSTNTSGWKDGELVPRVYVQPPADGMWDFDFIATRPTGIVMQVISTLETAPFVAEIPSWCRGVKVHASTNSATAALDMTQAERVSAVYFSRGITEGGVDYWPWAARREFAEAEAVKAAGNAGLSTCLSGSVTELNPLSICMDGATHQLNTIFSSPVRLRATSAAVKSSLDGFTNAKVIISACGSWVEGPECNHLEVYHVQIANISKSRGGSFIVIALSASLPAYAGCSIIPADSAYIATHSPVFGPATEAACEAWVAQHCGK